MLVDDRQRHSAQRGFQFWLPYCFFSYVLGPIYYYATVTVHELARALLLQMHSSTSIIFIEYPLQDTGTLRLMLILS